MTTEDILLAAGEASPDLMEKVAQTIVELEESDKDAAADLLKEIDAIASYAVEKTAGVADIAKAIGGVAKAAPGVIGRGAMAGGSAFARNAGKGAVIVGGMIGAGLAAAVATDLYDAAKRGATKSVNLKRIMEANPDLKKSVDKERLRQSFDAVHRYAPEMTADPLVGGAILKSVAELPGNEFTSIKAIIDARKSLQEAKHKSFSPVAVKPDDWA